MDWKSLFLSADGRIRRSEFWIGWLVIFAVNALLGWVIPLLSILLIYPTVCIFSKRLHDMGKTGWLQLIPVVVWCVAVPVAVLGLGAAFITAAAVGDADYQEVADALAAGGAAGFALFGAMALVAALVVQLVFFLWVGLSPGQPGENRFGKPSGAAAAAA